MKRVALFVFMLVVTVNTVVTMDPDGSYNYRYQRDLSSRNNPIIKVPQFFKAIIASDTKQSDSIEDNLNLASKHGLLPLLKTKKLPNALTYAQLKYFSEDSEENKKIAILIRAGSYGYDENFEAIYKFLYASKDQK